MGGGWGAGAWYRGSSGGDRLTKKPSVLDGFLMVAGVGLEPTTSGLWARRAAKLLYPATKLVRVYEMRR
jgi:hypothetical protein